MASSAASAGDIADNALVKTAPHRPDAGEVDPEVTEAENTSELLVFLKPGVNAGAFARDHGLTLGSALSADPTAFVFKAPTVQAAKALSTALGNDGRVRLADLNRRTNFQRMAFVPNDPYFPKNTPSGTWPGQWHLVNQHVTGRDARVQGAWDRNITGNGVTIGIVDDSLQTTHPDLSPNYVSGDSFDFGQNNGNPDPVHADDEHGTSVAGVAAARGGNGIGVTGAAPFAGLAGLRIDFPSQTTAMFVNATQYHSSGANTNIKVKNHSYGYSVPYISTLSEETALNTSANAGTIHAFAAANSRGGTGQDANKLDLQNSPNAITVAALGSNGTFASYSNFGANVFVTAPSSSGASLFRVTTTDRVGTTGYNTSQDTFPDPNYTSAFGGTSSASPLVAGVMALGKEAQPKLNTRFAKHMLVRTSDVVDPLDGSFASDGGWEVNGAGRAFNMNYGFGVIDASEFTLQSTRYRGVTTLQTESIPTQTVNQDLLDNSISGITRTFTLNSTTPLEDMLVTMNVTHSFRGDLEAWIRSPMGTERRLFIREGGDGGDNVNWTFLTNAFWGENPQGLWRLTLADVFSIDLGRWNSFSVTARMGELIEAVPGDADYDGDVDIADLDVLADNYGRTGDALWKFGDFDLDFDVDLVDLTRLATHYNGGAAQAMADFQSLSAVPEPGSFALEVLSLIMLRRRMRRQ